MSEEEKMALVRADGVTMAVQVSGLDQIMALAGVLAKAPTGAVPKALAGQPAAIAAVLLTAAEMRVGPMEALRGIHMIEGKAVLSSGLMLAQAMRSGVRVRWIEKGPEGVRAQFTRAGYPDHEESYTMAEARTAGLAGKGPWKAHPVAMLTARCVSRALTSWAPDALGAGVYVEGEIEDHSAAVTVEVSPAAAQAVTHAASQIDAAIGVVVDCYTSAQTEAGLAVARRARVALWPRLTEDQQAELETVCRAEVERVKLAVEAKAAEERERAEAAP